MLLSLLITVPLLAQTSAFWDQTGSDALSGHRLLYRLPPDAEWLLLREQPCWDEDWLPNRVAWVCADSISPQKWADFPDDTLLDLAVVSYNAEAQSALSNVVRVSWVAPLTCGETWLDPPVDWVEGTPCIGCGWCR